MEPEEKKTPKPEKPEKKQKRFVPNNTYFTISVYCLAVIFIGAIIVRVILSWDQTVNAIQQVISALTPFLLGLLIAFVLNPAVSSFYRLLHRRCRIKNETACKLLAILLTYVVVLGLIALILFSIIPQIISSITDLVNFIPTAAQEVSGFFDTLEERFPSLNIEAVNDAISNAVPNLIESASSFASDLIPTLYNVSRSIFRWLFNILVAAIVSVYMLADKKPLISSCKTLVYAFFPVRYIRLFLEICAEANRLFRSFIVGKALDSLIIGFLCFLIMSVLRLPYALLISVFIGITNMIPYFGPFIGAIPGAILLLFIRPLDALIFLVMVLVLQQFDGLILGPRILGNSTGMKPLWIIFAITVGGRIAGIIGMFLGVPTVAFLRYLIRRIIDYRLEKRKGTLPEQSPPPETD